MDHSLAGALFPAEPFPIHYFNRAPLGATTEQIVHIPSARGRRALVGNCPKTHRYRTLKTGRKGWHKTQIYNILRMAGQIVPYEKAGLSRIALDTPTIRFCQPMVTCQNQLRRSYPSKSGVHEYQAKAGSALNANAFHPPLERACQRRCDCLRKRRFEGASH
jgi:hypothetical protein